MYNHLGTFYKGKSLTIGFYMPEGYNTSVRLQKASVTLNHQEYSYRVNGDLILVELESQQTNILSGIQNLVIVLQDSIFGTVPINCGSIKFVPIVNKIANESVNEVSDIFVYLKIDQTQISVDAVFYDIMKGRGVDHIEKTTVDGIQDIFTIYYSDGTTSEYRQQNIDNLLIELNQGKLDVVAAVNSRGGSASMENSLAEIGEIIKTEIVPAESTIINYPSQFHKWYDMGSVIADNLDPLLEGMFAIIVDKEFTTVPFSGFEKIVTSDGQVLGSGFTEVHFDGHDKNDGKVVRWLIGYLAAGSTPMYASDLPIYELWVRKLVPKYISPYARRLWKLVYDEVDDYSSAVPNQYQYAAFDVLNIIGGADIDIDSDGYQFANSHIKQINIIGGTGNFSLSGNNQFNNLVLLSSIVFPESVGGNFSISGYNQFYNLALLSSIVFPESVGGNFSLSGNNQFNNLALLSSIVFPESVGGNFSLSGVYQFQSLALLSSIVFPESVGGNFSLSGVYQFHSLALLSSIVFPESVGGNFSLSGNSQFASLALLSSMTFPNQVKGRYSATVGVSTTPNLTTLNLGTLNNNWVFSANFANVATLDKACLEDMSHKVADFSSDLGNDVYIKTEAGTLATWRACDNAGNLFTTESAGWVKKFRVGEVVIVNIGGTDRSYTIGDIADDNTMTMTTTTHMVAGTYMLKPNKVLTLSATVKAKLTSELTNRFTTKKWTIA